MFLLLIMFIGVMPVNKVIQVLGARVCHTPPGRCVLTTPVEAPSTTVDPTGCDFTCRDALWDGATTSWEIVTQTLG